MSNEKNRIEITYIQIYLWFEPFFVKEIRRVIEGLRELKTADQHYYKFLLIEQNKFFKNQCKLIINNPAQKGERSIAIVSLPWTDKITIHANIEPRLWIAALEHGCARMQRGYSILTSSLLQLKYGGDGDEEEDGLWGSRSLGHKRGCNVKPSPTNVSPTKNSWMLHPLDKISLGYCAPDRTIPSLNSVFLITFWISF